MYLTKQKYLSFLLLFFLPFFLFSQFPSKRANIWYFGNAGIDFNVNPPSPLFNNALYAVEGTSSICDTSGNLLFYTNGKTVINYLHDTMQNGTGLMGGWSSSQAVLIVSQPGNDSLFYIFTTDDIQNFGANGFRYSIVNLNLDSGRGNIILKNIELFSPSTEKVAAVKHCNGRDIWVVTHACNSDAFYSYLITPSGLDTIPVVSNTGWVHQCGQNLAYGLGCIKFSTNGDKLAVAVPDLGIQLFNFNTLSGNVSDPLTLDTASLSTYENFYGIEFSLDGTKLYYQYDLDIYQLNLAAGTLNDILNSKTLLPPSANIRGQLQLAPDGKIYVAKTNDSIDVINQPDSGGLLCNYSVGGFTLSPQFSEVGLPNFIQTYLAREPVFCFSHIDTCYGDSTFFEISNMVGIDSVHWNFGDSASGSFNFAEGSYAYHIFTEPGTYYYSLTAYFGNQNKTLLRSLIILPNPVNLNIGTDTIMCFGDSLFLNAQNGFSYQWQDNSTDSMYIVTQPGNYFVAINNQCGFATDSISINYISPPLVSFGSDSILCNGDTMQLTASNENAIYQWQDNSQDSIYTILQQGTYWVYVSNQCGTASDTIVITYLNSPTVNLGSDTVLCINQEFPLSAYNPSYVYLWQNGSINANYTVSSTGTYWVLVSNQCGVSSDTIEIIYKNSPSVNLGNDTTLCEGENVLLTPIALTTNINFWQWQNGSTDSVFLVNTAGQYWLMVSNECGNASDTILVQYDSIPVFSLGPDTTLCFGDFISLKIPHDINSWYWQNGNTDSIYTVTQQGIYWLNVTEGACSARDTIMVNYFPELQLSLGNDTLLCKSDTLILDAGDWVTYQWSDSSTNQKLTVIDSGVYSVTVKDTNGCIATDSIVIAYDTCVGINELQISDLKFRIYPNPFCEATIISFFLPEGNSATISIYNLIGQKVKEIHSVKNEVNEIQISAEEIGEGVYICCLEFDGRRVVKKLVVMR